MSTKDAFDLVFFAKVTKDKGIIDRGIPYEKVGGAHIGCIDHQLLLNWFRVHLNQIEKVLPRLTIKFLAYNSPFLPRGPAGRIFTTDYSPVPGSGVQGVRFTPDAVFSTTDSIAEKMCLFFLEVDCGTETLSSPQRDMTDIRQKILNYQWYFLNLQYKRYEDLFNVSYLNGFRLLFMTRTSGRLAALCQLTQQMHPSNFIWLTDRQRIFEDGVSWRIWARGGDLQTLQHSILGSRCCRAPLLA